MLETSERKGQLKWLRENVKGTPSLASRGDCEVIVKETPIIKPLRLYSLPQQTPEDAIPFLTKRRGSTPSASPSPASQAAENSAEHAAGAHGRAARAGDAWPRCPAHAVL